MAIAATIAVNVIAKTQEFQSAMSSLSDRLENVGERISSTGQKLTGAFTVPLAAATAGIYKAVEAAADLEETQNAVGVVFGETTPQILAFAETAATSFGQSTEEALRAAQTFGMFGQAAGLSGDQTVKFSTDLVALAADFASIQNTSPEDAIMAIGAALRGEAEPIRRFNVLLDDYTLKQRAMAMGIIETTSKALTPQQKVLAAHAEILEQGAYAQGDFARTSEGLANQQRILSAELTNAAAELGQAFLPVALQLVTVVRDEIVPAVVRFAEFMNDLSPEVIASGAALGAFLAAAGPVLMIIGQIVQVGGLLVSVFSAPVAALVALGAAMAVVYTRSETFREIVNGLIASLVSLVQTIMGVVAGGLTWIAQKIVAVGEGVIGLADRFGLLPASVRNAVDTAKQIINELRAPSLDLGVTGSNAAAVDALYGPVMDASATVGEQLETSATRISVAQGEQRDALVTLMNEGITPVTDALVQNQTELGLNSQNLAQMTLDMIDNQGQLESLTTAQVDAQTQVESLTSAQGIFQTATETAKQKLDGLKSGTMDLASKFTPLGMLMEILGEAFEVLKPVVESLMEPFRIIGLVLGKALASILRALFPIIKMVAINFTYVGQVVFKVAELLAKAIGYAVYGIGKAIDAIPFVSAKKVIRAGQALIDLGNGFGDAYDDLGKAREEIRGLELPEEKAEETANTLNKTADASEKTAENTKRIADQLEEQNKRPPVQVVVNAGPGTDGARIGRDVARQLDDYYGRGIIYEERGAGRVDAFNE